MGSSDGDSVGDPDHGIPAVHRRVQFLFDVLRWTWYVFRPHLHHTGLLGSFCRLRTFNLSDHIYIWRTWTHIKLKRRYPIWWPLLCLGQKRHDLKDQPFDTYSSYDCQRLSVIGNSP